jgi:hypothetical protein
MRGKAWLGRAASLTGLAVLLSGCAGWFGPDQPTGTPFAYNGVNWMVIDDTATGTVAISPATPQVLGPGTLGGYRLPVGVDALPTDEYRAAAMGWLAHTGRFCTVGADEDQDQDGGFLDSSNGLFSDPDQQAAARTFPYRCSWLP